MKAFQAAAGKFLTAEREVLLAFLATRLLVCGVAWFAFYAFAHGEMQVLPSARPWNLLFRWDALWYARIVQRGYDYTPDVQSSAVFFPLLPLLIGAFRKLTGAWTPFAGFVISNTALLGAGLLLRRLTLLDFSRRLSQRAVWLLFLCPMTFFHSAAYTESLFLFLSLGTIYFARKQQWLSAGIAGALLTATRANGVFILIPLMWETLVAQRITARDVEPPRGVAHSRWWLLLVPSGLVAFASYLHWRFGDALAFVHAQPAFYREFATPWEAIKLASAEPFPAGPFQVTAAFGAVMLCWLSWRQRLRVSYQCYAAATVLLFLSSTHLASLPRLLSVVFPFYIAVAALRSEAAYTLALITSTAVMAVCLALFVCGYVMT